MSYSQAGVDIDAGNLLIERIKPAVKKTFRPGVLHGLGGFGALFELPVEKYNNPVLVSGTDGVGTKLKLASMLNQHDTIGIDLVAMCVNDIVVCGAEPLYFLDYFATGKLDVDQAEQVIGGIAQGCSLAGCALTGGETAEMPGMYDVGDYDLAGFAVGIVEKSDMISIDRVKPGDIVLGLASSGLHSNGYSLVRKIIEMVNADLDQKFADTTLGHAMLAPTKIYVKSILQLIKQTRVSAISHITGGGILENIPRVLPLGLAAELSESAWEMPELFRWLKQNGNLEQSEMLRTFNCGIGMVVVVDSADVDEAVDSLENSGETVYTLGEIVKSDSSEVIFRN